VVKYEAASHGLAGGAISLTFDVHHGNGTEDILKHLHDRL
jgi:acetoin utilization deacetylase AcuC-like enzyme